MTADRASGPRLSSGGRGAVGSEPSDGSSERRRAPRYEPTQLREDVYVVGARLLNIGAHGAMLEAPVPLPSDSDLRLHLMVGGLRTRVEGRVCGCLPRRDGRRQVWFVGIEFVSMSVEDRERLALALVPKRNGRR